MWPPRTHGSLANSAWMPWSSSAAARTLAWTFDLDAVATRVRYSPELADATTPFEVAAAIEAFRARIPLRPRRTIPA